MIQKSTWWRCHAKILPVAAPEGLDWQLYLQEAACHQAAEREREAKALEKLSKEEYLKMMLEESGPGEDGCRKMSATGSLSPRRSLYRTLSDESVCSSNRRGSSYASSHSSMLDQALPNDILFSTTPPYHATLPPRMPGQGGSNLRNEFWFSDGSLADRSKFNDPGLMPLPDPASGLDWSHLVDAARTFEGKNQGSVCALASM
nr:signal-induced proliferation-associated 1-like protein 2 [Salvelinus alpinus]